jgi:hypothetical protein
MELDFSSSDELNELIRQINLKYYERLNANILYLEELNDQIFIIYIIELRDAYSHLVRVHDYDINNPDGRRNIQSHLEKYINHLQNGLLDTFRKILEVEYKSARKAVHRNNVRSFDHYVAQKASELRVMNETNTVDNRIDGYIELLRYLSETREKLVKS